MIISPPFLPVAGMTSTDPALTDPMMSAVDNFELAHGVYPIALDRRWHTGVHLYPAMRNEKVRAIADGEVVAYRVCQHAINGGTPMDSNPGFVLLKHTTETGEGRTLTFYSLYMHLLELSAYNSLGVSGNELPEFLRMPSPGESLNPPLAPPAQTGGGKKVYRKDVLGLPGRCHGQRHIHFEIFMLPNDFDHYFAATQLGNTQLHTPRGADYWGHSYYIIPAGQTFVPQPPGTVDGKLHGIAFDPLPGGQNAQPLHIESHFHKGNKYTSVWSVAADGSRTPLVKDKAEPEYEYKLYERAMKLYPGCPSDGYELLRFGRILSGSPTLPAGAARTTWVRAAFATGQEGYIDLNNDAIVKLSDADFPFLANWQKVDEGNGPFADDGLCDIDRLKAMLGTAKEHQTQQEQGELEEYKKEETLVRYVRSTAGVRDLLKGFVCRAPSEWDGTNNDARYGKLLSQEGEFYYGDSAGYGKFIALLKQFQFWDVAHLPAGTKFWFFHPLQFIRCFRKNGWLSAKELAQCLPRSSESVSLPWSDAYQRSRIHHQFVSRVNLKYLGSNPIRLLHFLAQTYIETGGLRTMREDSLGDGHSYGPFYGRGYLQLTWPVNYEAYNKYRLIPNNSASSFADTRITSSSMHIWADGGIAKRWAPQYDPEIIATDLAHSAESSGMYWLSKHFRRTTNINRAADLGASPTIVGFISWLINGGGNGYRDRQQFSTLLGRMLLDTVGHLPQEVLRYPPLAPASNPVLCRTFPPTIVPFSLSVVINYVPQIP
ncbi:peptidase M23 [Paraburkholderia sp. IW21]|uniref:peptidase M23 n=1 Tax=Paraburkholderia sp. IW21 TaxID=3242488 RepID=UPI0035214259